MKRFVFHRKWLVKWPLVISGTLLIIICLAGVVRFIEPPTSANAASAPKKKVFNTSAGSCTQGQVDPQIWKDGAFFRGSIQKKEVALTFDDGPSPNTGAILDILKEQGIHATFFMMGVRIGTDPQHINAQSDMAKLVQREKDEGNEVANHTWTHPDLTTLSPDRVRSELSQTSDLIERLAGSKPTHFRPPFGATNKDVQSQASQLGMATIGWTVDTCDWTQTLQGGATTDDIVNGVLDNVENGSIILMHDGGNDRSKTVQALTRIITGLKSRGFQFAKIEQMTKVC